MNDLPWSFGGENNGTTQTNDVDDTEGGVFWRPVFGSLLQW
jgi:hypothetical protein